MVVSPPVGWAYPFPVEPVPKEDHVYLRVHQNHIDAGGTCLPAAFRDRSDPQEPWRVPGMSCEWDHYQKDPAQMILGKECINGVVRLNVGGILEIEGLSVEHTPY